MDDIFGILRYRRRNGVDGMIDMRQTPADHQGAEVGSEPHIERDTGSVLVADSRLDDRDALRGALGVSGPTGAALSDRALILRAYMRWGRECPNHLLGDYAFAVYDARTRSLFCARDHIGCRPFYYALTSECFIFSSTVAPVLAAPGVSDALDERMVRSYLSRVCVRDASRTFFRAVRKLPPGHSLTVDTAASSPVRLERYWHPERVPRVRPAGDEEYAAEFLDLYGRAVKDRLHGGPVGVHLSGGLDSSSIAVLAARELRRQGGAPPPAFSWLPPRGDGPLSATHAREYALIDSTAAREGLRVYHCQILGPDDFVSFFRQDVAYPRVPVPEELVQRRAENLGLRVLLSGVGGDECVSFNGRGYAESLLLCGRWRRLAAECSAREKDRIRFLARIVLQLVHPDLPRYLVRRRFGRRSRHPGGRWLIHPAFAQQVRPLPDPRVRNIGVRRTQLRLLRDGNLSGVMEGLRATRHGIEYRYPLTDRRLLEFALGLSPEQFRRGRWGRWLMRYALQSVLPSEICWRQDKSTSAMSEPLQKTLIKAFPTLRQEIAARAETMSRAHYVDIPRLLDRLDANRFRARLRPAPLTRALGFLDF